MEITKSLSQLSNNKIIIIFEENLYHLKENIKNSIMLQQRFSDIYTFNEVKKEPDILKQYQVLIDGSNNNKIYSSYLKNKNGIEIKEGIYSYLKTTTNKYVIKCPTISQLSLIGINHTKEEEQRQQVNLNTYIDIVRFISLKIPAYRNLLYYENGVKSKGIDFSNYVQSNGPSQKTYKLVNEIPEKEDSDSIYLTTNGVEILDKLIEISKYIKF